MSLAQRLKRPSWRTLVVLFAILGVAALAYALWSPGHDVTDGRHDLGTNGIWLQHGWIGHDEWFDRYGRDRTKFRDAAKIRELAELLSRHGMAYVFPHLCPCDPDGQIAPVDDEQTALFLEGFQGIDVLPWIGGVFNDHAFPESEEWRATFVGSAIELLDAHPRFAGVHVNIEPMPSGNADYVRLLRELREALPEGKRLSIAAYPPPTRLHPFPSVHWDETYYREVCTHVDQVAPMMYDTAQRLPKVYQALMASWTRQVLTWAGDTEVLLGVPAYEDANVAYHDPRVENLRNGLLGIHAGLARLGKLPSNYRGLAIYSEWEMDEGEWRHLESHFGRRQE